jgi:hypothetical protein
LFYEIYRLNSTDPFIKCCRLLVLTLVDNRCYSFLVAALIPQKAAKSFLSGFIALFLLWGSLAWYISSNNNHLLAHKVSLLILKLDSPALLIAATAFTGALVAGFAALAGSYLRQR